METGTTIELMGWRIGLRAAVDTAQKQFPEFILTEAPRFQHGNMPNEVSLLLPTNAGIKRLIDAVIDKAHLHPDGMLGLFLADPFLNLPLELARLADTKIRWATNLPSVGQQDTDFEQQLTDVGLDFSRELKKLSEIKSYGYRIAIVVADAASAKSAAALEPEAMIILPRIADFAAGFPSLRQRRSMALDISLALEATGWTGALLGLGEATELDHERQWPEPLDGLVCRPQILG
ncbi:hypothetical protein GQF03_10785 [Sneathiella chungangensis]|uniref:Uncharacterized protein n=1 Tax=Sneathiella chungangensis TaxID=1418234 RepID=A0A845MHL0_9PROT|nr:hypothetical protein [Sneathiella chungangensis]MZR22816.1 hypothetical protein [Sneathiella chungangensis]